MSTGSHSEVQLENEHFRVTRWTIEPGGTIPMHRHEYEYVVVPLVTAAMHVRTVDGAEFVTELQTGTSYSRPSGSEHEISNPEGDEPIIFVEVERL